MRFTQHSAGGHAPAHRWLGRVACGCLLGLALVAAGCVEPPAPASAPAAAVVNPAAAQCPVEKVSVTQVGWFQDSRGAWRVVGMIDNKLDHAVGKIVTDVEALDAAGQVIDHGEDISAYPLNLQPGARAPFSAWIKRDFRGIDRFRVTVSECIVAENVERSSAVQVRGDRLSFDGAGRGQIVAELVNTGDKPVLVNGLMGAVLDAAGAPLAADNGAVSARYLAPGEHGPARVTLDLPPGGQARVSSHQLVMDAITTEARPSPLDASRDLRVTARYLDAEGRFHLAGEVTNRGQDSLTLRLQATLYDDATKTGVLDAAFLDTPLPLAPGETWPFDFVNWGVVHGESATAGELARLIAADEVRVEPFDSWAGGVSPVTATLLNTSSSLTGQQAQWTGRVKNGTGRSITNALVTAVVRDRQRGQVLATSSALINAVAGWSDGESRDYALTIEPSPGLGARDASFSITAVAR